MTQHSNFRDPALYERIMLPLINPDGVVNLASLEADFRWYVGEGLVGEAVEPRALVDNQYAEYAVAQLGAYRR